MKKFIFLAFLGANTLSSQTYNWAKRIDSDYMNIKKMLTTSTGDVIVGGVFWNTVDFDPGPGTFNLNTQNSLTDIFIAKYSSSGNFISAFKLGGGDGDSFIDFTIDNSGNIFFVGEIWGIVDMNKGSGVNNLGGTNLKTSFIVKYNSAFSYQWAKGFDPYLTFKNIRHDANGSIIFFGEFSGTIDFNPGAQINNLISTAGSDMCIGKLLSNGSYSWAKKIGEASSGEIPRNLFVDPSNNLFITGVISGTVDFNPLPNVTSNLTSGNNASLFFAKYDNAGSFGFAKLISPTNNISPTNISCDSSGNIIISGTFGGTVDFDPSSGVQNMVSPLVDLFVVKYNNKGSFLWSRKIGNSSIYNQLANHVLDNNGNIVLYGSFRGVVDFNPTSGIYNLQSTSPSSYADIFVSVITSSGGFSSQAIKIGNDKQEILSRICMDNNNNILIAGSFSGTIDFDPSPNSNKLIATGKDHFIAKYSIAAINNPKIMEQEEFNTIAADENKNNTMLLFPNPSSEKLNITVDGEIENIQIFDVIGKLQQNVTVDIINKTIDVSALPNNIYFLSVTIDKETPIVSKFIKQ